MHPARNLKIVFSCGQVTVQLWLLSIAFQHFVCDVSDRSSVPPLRLLLNNAELLSLHEHFTAYFQLVQTTAKQRMKSRYFSIFFIADLRALVCKGPQIYMFVVENLLGILTSKIFFSNY